MAASRTKHVFCLSGFTGISLEVDTMTKSAPATVKKRPGKAYSSFHIVGIGASAGGIEAYKTLFKSLEPVPNAAIVCILHLPVSKKTSLIGTFAKAFAPLHFEEICHGKTIRPGSVYFNVTGSAVSIDKRKFRVAGPVKNPPMLTVDHFFRSLAA